MKRQLLCFLASVTTFLSVAQAGELTPDQQEEVRLKSAKWMVARQQADALMTKKKYEEAEKLYQTMLAERKDLGLDLFSEYDRLGALYTAWGKSDKAENAYEEMVAARELLEGADSPDVVFPLQEFAACLERNGKLAQAKDLRARAARIEKDAVAMPVFNKVDTAQGISPEAVVEAERMCVAGERLTKNDQQQKALVCFNRAVQLNPNDPKAVLLKGQCEDWLEQPAKALADFNLAIKMKPDFVKAYIARSYSYEAAKRYPLALADLKQAMILDGKNCEVLGAYARLLAEVGKLVEAAAVYSQAIEVNTALYWTYEQRAKVYSDLKKFDLALADYTTLVERAPNDTEFREARAATYFKAGDYEKALADYNKLIETNPKYSLGYSGRAQVFEKLDGKRSPRVMADLAIFKKLGG